MADPRAARIIELRVEIARLNEVLKRLDGLPDVQVPYLEQLATKQAELDTLLAAIAGDATVQTGGINIANAQIKLTGDIFTGDKTVVQAPEVAQLSIPAEHKPSPAAPLPVDPSTLRPSSSLQTGGINFGNAKIGQTGDIFTGDKYESHVSAQRTGALHASPVLSLQLWLEDANKNVIANPVFGQETVLRAGVEGDPAQFPALTLTLDADAAGVAWPEGTRRSLALVPGAMPQPVRWSFVAREVGDVTFRITALANSAFVQQATLTTVVRVAAAPVLTMASTGSAAPPPTVPVGLSLSAAPAVAAHSQGLTLIIDPEREGFRLRLLDGGSTTPANVALTDHQIADLLAYTRTELLEIVHHKDNGGYTFGQADLTIKRAQAEWALAKLARVGAYLWQQLFAGPGSGDEARRLGERLRARSQSGPLHLTVVASHLPFPWPLLYDGDPTKEVMVDGFWGFRHVLATLPTSGRTGPRSGEVSLGPAAGLPTLVGYNLGINYHPVVPMPPGVIAPQQRALKELGLTPTEVPNEAALRHAIATGTDSALLYLYCHVVSAGPDHQARPANVSRAAPGVGSTRIILTDGPNALTLRDLQLAAPLDGTPRLRGGPLVILNACGSADLSPLTYDGLAPYLLDLGARALVGTECETPITFAAAFGPALLTALLRDAKPLGEALRDTRRYFWEQHRNPLGLLYALYGNPDLRVGQ